MKLPTGNFTIDIATLVEVSAIVPAICLHRYDVVEALIARFPTCATSPCDSDKRTALHYAVQYGSVSMVQFLVRNFKVNPCSSNKLTFLTPLFLAAQTGSTAELQVMMEEGILMLENNVTKDDHGRSLLHLAALHGRVDTVNYLLSLIQTDIGAIDDEGNTALHLAARAGHLLVVKVFLMWKRGTAGEFDVNTSNRKGQTALHLAALNGRDSVVAELCKNGSRIHTTLRDFSKASPVELATENGHVRVVQILVVVVHEVGYEKELRGCELAIVEAEVKEKARLLSSQASLLFDQHAENPLMALWEVLNDEYSSVELAMAIVMDKRCGLERRSTLADGEMNAKGGFVLNKEQGGVTPLIMATQAGRVDVMEALLSAGADVHAEDEEKTTAISVAAIDNNPSAIELLVSFASNVNPDGSTPLHHAAFNCNLEAIEMLVAKGADITKVNNCGRTPLNSFEKKEKEIKRRSQEVKDRVRELLTSK